MTAWVRRREFITLLGGAAAGWPLAGRAQQPAKLPTIGYFGTTSASAWGPWTTAFGQRLRELGWIEGRTVAIHYRWTEGRAERLAEIAAEFVRLKVDVIVTGGNAAVAAKQASSVVPIVFALVDDPVGSGLVASLARPGGNVTGLSMQSDRSRWQATRTIARGCAWSPPGGDHGQRRLSRRCAGDGRDSSGGRHARPRCRHLRNPASGGHHARLRGAQGPRGSTLCCWRCPRNDPPGPNQHPGALRTTADDFLFCGSTSKREV